MGRIHPVFHLSLQEPCPPSLRMGAQEVGAQLDMEDNRQNG